MHTVENDLAKLNAFLSPLNRDHPVLIDNDGKAVDFGNSIFFFIYHATNEEIKQIESMKSVETFVERRNRQHREIFTPGAFVGRLSKTIFFPLGDDLKSGPYRCEHEGFDSDEDTFNSNTLVGSVVFVAVIVFLVVVSQKRKGKKKTTKEQQ